MVHFQTFSSSNFPCGSCRGLWGQRLQVSILAVSFTIPLLPFEFRVQVGSRSSPNFDIGLVLQAFFEYVREETFGKFGLQQIQVWRNLNRKSERKWLAHKFGYPMLSCFYIHIFNVITYYHQHPDLAVSGLHHDSQAHKIQTHSTQYPQ